MMRKFKAILIIPLLCLTVLSGCSLPGLGGSSSDDEVKITAVTNTESQIMAHMVRVMIEHDTKGKLKPSLVNNLGSSTIQHKAITTGDANMSGARYTGTDLTGALNEDPIKDPDKALKATQEGFQNASIHISLTHTVSQIRMHLWSRKKPHVNTISKRFQI